MKSLAALAFAAALFLASGHAAWTQDEADAPGSVKTTTETVGDWTITCTIPESGQKSCVLWQRLSNAETGAIVLAWLVGENAEGRRLMTLRTPLGLLLQEGVVLEIDAQETVPIEFRTCVQAYCEAVRELSENVLSALRAGAQAKVIFRNIQEQTVTITVSLDGFSKGYDIFDEELAVR